MKRSIVVLIFVVLLVGAGELHRHLSAQVVTEEPAVVVSPTYVMVPPKQQEVITTAPSPQYVWVQGQWERTPDNWSWSAGRWVQPPFSNAYWVPGYWKHRSGQYAWQPAHWGVANQGVVVAKPVTVPPLYTEVQPPAPATTNVVWQPGHWEWRGTWVWVAGEYISSTAPSAVWVAGAWVTGADGNWRWNPAHWAVT
jgi:hypothetical protein